MTREEREKHLDWLYRLKSEIFVFMPTEWIIPMVNALDMAIKALKQKTYEDTISRGAVLDLARKGVLVSNDNFESVCKAINDIPPSGQIE